MAKVKVAMAARGSMKGKMPVERETASRIVVRVREDKHHTSARIESGNREAKQRRGDFVIEKSDGNVTISVDA